MNWLRLVPWLRATLGIGLLGLLISTGPSRNGETISVDAGTDIPAILANHPVPPPLYYDRDVPPTPTIASHLSVAAARGGTVTLQVPAEVPSLVASGPGTLVAGRRGSIRFKVALPETGERGDTVRLHLTDEVGLVDTLTFVSQRTGWMEGSIPVELNRPGRTSWTLSRKSDTVALHAWVSPAAPVKVLFLGGPPSWESRFLVRALESGGAEVSVRQSLGRGLSVSGGGEGEGSPTASATGDPADASPTPASGPVEIPMPYDVVVVGANHGEDVESVSLTAIADWAREAGGGVLILGGVGEQTTHTTQGLSWRGPPEIVPLPHHDFAFLAGPAPESPGAHSWVSGPDSTQVATLEFVGEGRIARINMETWPWVMEAGLAEAHQRFWETTVEWLANGVPDQLVEGPTGIPLVRWTGKWYTGEEVRRLDFVPAAQGGFPVASDSTVGIVVPAPSTSNVSWPYASLVVAGAGGEVVLEGAASRFRFAQSTDIHGSLRLLAFLVLGTLAVAGWSIRRLSGLR